MRAEPRVAFFPDLYLEVNGVAYTSRHLVAYAKREGHPLICVHAGAGTRSEPDRSVEQLVLRRSLVQFRLDADLRFDLRFWRHAGCGLKDIREFDPDVIHLTARSDVGLLGAWVAKIGDAPAALLEIIADLPKRTEWAQARLAEAVATLREWGEDPADYVAIEMSVPESRYAAWPPRIRALFEPARTVGSGRPSYTLTQKAPRS